MKLNILLTTGIISLALLSGCDKDSEQPTSDIAIPATTTAPEATTDPAYEATIAPDSEETTDPDSEATTAPAEMTTPATKEDR